MMPMNKRRYSKDFREQALSKVYSRPDEQNIDDIATELHMNVGTLKGWMRKATKDQKGPPSCGIPAGENRQSISMVERHTKLVSDPNSRTQSDNRHSRQHGKN